MTAPTRFTLRAALVSSVALTAACSTNMSDPATRAQASARTAATGVQIDADSARLTDAQATNRPANIQVEEGLYLGRDGYRTGRGDPLPREFEGENGVSMNLADTTTIAEFAQLLKTQTGIRVDYRDLYATPSTGDAGGGGGRAGTASGSGGQGQIPAPPQVSGNAGQEGQPAPTHPASVAFRVDYTGSLSGLLDHVASQIGSDWEYTGGRIRFLGPQTRTYTLWALPGSVTTESSVGDSDNDAFGGTQPSTTTSERSFDYWSAIESGLAAIVPDQSADYALNRGAGTITVTGFQAVHRRVMRFIERENTRLSRQVALKVDVLAFSATDSSRRSTNLALALENASAGFELASPGQPIDGATSLSASVIDSDNDLADSSAIVSALSEQGRVSLLKSASVIARNNTPTPLSIASEVAYLASSETETDEQGNATTTLETGVINNGINITFTPRVLSSNQVVISYAMTLSELQNIERFESGNSAVQLPEVDTRNFMQTLNIDSGDSIVVASFDSRDTSRETSGPFDPRFWGLGGSSGFNIETTKIAILMTPVVLERQNAPIARR